MKYWEIVAKRLSKLGYNWGCCSAIDNREHLIYIADASRGDGKRFIAASDELLTALLELEWMVKS